MKDVYKNSLLTIAATGATDPSIGCFRDREPELIETLKFRAHALDGPEVEYVAVEYGIFRDNIRYSPICRRGWILQERLLSSRVLHFGKHQMLWECNELDACESHPYGIKAEVASNWYSKKGLLTNNDEDSFQQKWQSIIELYTSCQLTQPSDKCLAIAGIADEFHSLSETSYVAGLWRESLELGLLWRALVLPDFNGSENRLFRGRATTYTAPSWSWLSYGSDIEWFPFHEAHQEILLEIVDIALELHNNNKFGPFKSGHVRARGMLSPVTWHPDTRPVQPGDSLIGEIRSIRGHSCNINALYMDEGTETEHEIFCVPIVRSREARQPKAGRGELFGLILARTGAEPHEYRRIGMFKLCNDQPNHHQVLRLLQYRLRKRKWRALAKSTFTIV